MLHILLLILKIIGITLLVIVGLVFATILMGLFVPVRYRVTVSRREGAEEPPVTVSGKVTWLLHIINIPIRYPAKAIVRVRLFFITLFAIPEQEKRADRRRKKEKKANKKRPEKAEEGKETEKYEKNEKASVPGDTMADDTRVGNGQSFENEKEADEPKKRSFLAKIGAFWERLVQLISKIKGALQNIRYTISNICDKIKSVSDNIQHYREILEGDVFKQSFGLCKEQLGGMFFRLKPDKFKADFVVGMDDPASTGQILAIYGMLYPFIGGCVNVKGDFEKKRIEGKLYLKGKIRMFTFIRVVGKLYFNKDVKKLIRLLKKEAV